MMKRKIAYVTDWKGTEGDARLKHYNEWLLGERPFGSVYPGFPGDQETVQPVPVTTKPVALNTKTSHNTHTETKGHTMTKLAQAIEIVRANPEKQAALAAIVETLGVTRANAFVYFTKATKALGVEPVAKEKKAKAPVKAKEAPVRTSKITEISEREHKARVAEIDEVIAGLKQKIGTASPFPVAA